MTVNNARRQTYVSSSDCLDSIQDNFYICQSCSQIVNGGGAHCRAVPEWRTPSWFGRSAEARSLPRIAVVMYKIVDQEGWRVKRTS